MPFQEFESFDDLARSFLNSEELIHSALPDIECTCLADPKGFKKKQNENNQSEAFERATAILHQKYKTADEFKKAITNPAFKESAKVNAQLLHHFAEKWRQSEQQAQMIESNRNSTETNIEEILIYHGGFRNQQLLTREELDKKRERKQQSKKMRKEQKRW